MNNKNKILVGCLALLLVLSVGYALFSDTITINGTATAKGDFNLEVTCMPGLSEEFNQSSITVQQYNSLIGSNTYTTTNELLSVYPEGNYSNDSCMVTDNTVSYQATVTAPGARRYFTIKVENNGSIPATVTDSYIGSNHKLSGTVTLSDGTVKDTSELTFVSAVKDSSSGFVGLATTSTNVTGESMVLESGNVLYIVYVIQFPEQLLTETDYTDVDLLFTNSHYFEFTQITN